MRLLCAITITASLIMLSVMAVAKETKSDGPALRFGMSVAEADAAVADGAVWRIAYRVDTASTTEIACVWKDTVFYIARFLNGSCVYVEKRADLRREEIERVVTLYNETYGVTTEASQDREENLIFARWTLPDREISLTALKGSGTRFKVIYEEQDAMRAGQAKVVQERELREQPMEQDPLTGRLRPVRQPPPGETPDGSDAAPAPDETDDAAPDAQDSDAEDDAPPEESEPPQRDPEPGDW